MKKLILICPDSFKESLSAQEVSSSISHGIQKVTDKFEIEMFPMADGGEGTLEVIHSSRGGEISQIKSFDPLQREITADVLILENKACLIETAKVIGLPLLKEEERNPALASTYGLGTIIKYCYDQGVRNFILSLGGSSTNDAGCGMMQALGLSYTDSSGRDINAGGMGLKDLHEIDISNIAIDLSETEFTFLCDVDNTLCGENGASLVYSMQKGADYNMARDLDKALENFADVVKKQYNTDLLDIPGLGAAGGIAAGLYPFSKVKIKSGASFIMDLIGLSARIKDAFAVITGEGRIDRQSEFGKVVGAVAAKCKQENVSCIAINGSTDPDFTEMYKSGLTAGFSSIPYPADFEKLKQHAFENIALTTMNVIKLLLINC